MSTRWRALSAHIRCCSLARRCCPFFPLSFKCLSFLFSPPLFSNLHSCSPANSSRCSLSLSAAGTPRLAPTFLSFGSPWPHSIFLSSMPDSHSSGRDVLVIAGSRVPKQNTKWSAHARSACEQEDKRAHILLLLLSLVPPPRRPAGRPANSHRRLASPPRPPPPSLLASLGAAPLRSKSPRRGPSRPAARTGAAPPRRSPGTGRSWTCPSRP